MINFVSREMIIQEPFQYYVVFRGRVPGMYNSWEEASNQVIEYPGYSYKGFNNWFDAHNEWMNHLIRKIRERHHHGSPISVVAVPSMHPNGGGKKRIVLKLVQMECELCTLEKQNEALHQLVDGLRDCLVKHNLAYKLDD
ncbi:hypothetical protein S83_020549 [Arachis hypogaea]|nr:ATP-dependent DNA helicase [Arachis hypogaea]